MPNSSNSRVGQYLGCLVLVDGYTQELTEQEEGVDKERTGRDGRNDIYLRLVTVRSSLATVPLPFFFPPSGIVQVWHREVQVHRVLDRRDGWGWRWDVSTMRISVAPASLFAKKEGILTDCVGKLLTKRLATCPSTPVVCSSAVGRRVVSTALLSLGWTVA